MARTFLTWSQVAAQGCHAWSRENLVLAQKIVQGIEGGRPLATAVERLSSAMSEASQNLETEMLEGLEARKQAGKKTGSQPTEGDFFNIPDEDAAGFKDFIGEGPEHLTSIERNLLALSKGESWDVLQVYRAFHTLKGVCGFMNLPKMAALAHKAEARLEPFKQGQGRPSEDQVDWLLQACDLIREQVQAIAQGLPLGRFRILSFERLLGAEGPALSQAALTPTNTAPTVEKGENSTEASHAHAGDASIRISVEKMDALLEIVGELAICQSQVSGGVEALGVTGHLSAETSRLIKISKQLQDLVLSLRMVPVEPLFLRMSRLARDLSRKTEKPLVLELEGGETEIDRRMVEELVEPLVHLIRNAVDHGIEPAGERKNHGKAGILSWNFPMTDGVWITRNSNKKPGNWGFGPLPKPRRPNGYRSSFLNPVFPPPIG
jgi:chemotaxis protein histidine kinase CheA